MIIDPAMKILMTADTVGGVWTYALELSRALGDHNVAVLLATMGAPLSVAQAREAQAIPNLAVCSSSYKLEWMDDPWGDVQAAGAWLSELAAAWQPDLVHLNGYVHAALPWKVPTLVVGHSCVLSWWQAVNGEPAPAVWAQYRAAVSRGLQAADLVVAPTQAMLNDLQQLYGPLHHTTVITNGRDPALISAQTKQPYVLSAGRLWDEAKNLALLDAAALHLAWPVYVAGSQQHPDGGAATCRYVQPLGVLAFTDLTDWLARAAIYALPARYEPFGLSVLEAALAGCALVLGDIASLREVWGDAALYVQPDDHNALALAINDLIAHEDERNRMAQRAATRARQFSIAQMAARYAAAYAQLLQQHPCCGESLAVGTALLEQQVR